MKKILIAVHNIEKYVLRKKIAFLIKIGKIGIISDKLYVKLFYKFKTGQKLNLKDPKTFNEKIQWLKLYDRRNLYTIMADKYLAKDYVASIIGKEYIIPLYGVYDSFDDINFDNLPNKFVLKTTHDSNGVIICKDKRNFYKYKRISKIY